MKRFLHYVRLSTVVVAILLVVFLQHSMVKVSQLFQQNSEYSSALISTTQLLDNELESIEQALAPSGIPLKLLQYATFEDSSALLDAADIGREVLRAIDRIESNAITPVQRISIGLIKEELLPLATITADGQVAATRLAETVALHNPRMLAHTHTALEALRQSSDVAIGELQQAVRDTNRQIRSIFKQVWYAGAALFLVFSYLIYSLFQLQRVRAQSLLNAQAQLKAEQRLHEQEHLNSVLFEALPVPVITIDERGKVESSNPATSALFGYTPGELQGQKIDLLMPARYAQEHDGYMQNYKKSGEAKIIGIGRAVQAVRADGSEIDVHLSVTEFISEGKRHFAGIIVDLSEITAKQAELELALQQVETVNTELEQAMLQVNAANEAKDRFLATASHEIRTPLTGMFGVMHMLQDTELQQEQRALLDTLCSSGRHLMVILNDILDAAKLRQGGIQLFPQPTQLGDLINQLGGTFSNLASSQSISFTARIDTSLRERWVEVDSVRLNQILSNLCSNAIKFTEQGEVRLNVEELHLGNTAIELEFSIEDTGCGIPEDQLEQLGTPFTQVDTALNRTGSGTGLGLSIVSALLQIMNSKLDIKSTEGQGSTFSFKLELPLAESQSETPVSQQEGEINWSGTPRILVAEDNRINRMVIENLLSKLPVDFDLVEDGAELLEQAQRVHYDLIISDIQMPRLDGLEAARKLREIPALQNTPMIALTAAAFEDEISRMHEVGYNDYVPKPIDRAKLIAAINRHLNRASNPKGVASF